MEPSSQCLDYQFLLEKFFSEKLALLAPHNVAEVTFILAGSICFAENLLDKKIPFYLIFDVMDVVVNALVFNNYCSHDEICIWVAIAIYRYRAVAIKNLGGASDATHQ